MIDLHNKHTPEQLDIMSTYMSAPYASNVLKGKSVAGVLNNTEFTVAMKAQAYMIAIGLLSNSLLDEGIVARHSKEE